MKTTKTKASSWHFLTKAVEDWAEKRFADTNGLIPASTAAALVNASDVGQVLARRYAYALDSMEREMQSIAGRLDSRPWRALNVFDDDLIGNAAMIEATSDAMYRLAVALHDGATEGQALNAIAEYLTKYVLRETRFASPSTSEIRNVCSAASRQAYAELATLLSGQN